MRLQEWWDARLVTHEKNSILEWTRSEKHSILNPAMNGDSPRPRRFATTNTSNKSRLHFAAFALWFCFVMSFAWTAPAGASYLKKSAVDSLGQSYRIPVTNPADGTALPSVLFFSAAVLDTTSPVNKNLHAPKGEIYLLLEMSSGPIQRNYGNPLCGDFFSGMTPLPASALRYVTAPGRSYAATRFNPIDQTFNSNAATDDGLVDATYFFTVPITNRRGAIIISPTHTAGVPYHGFTGFASVHLIIGGPTNIALSFPKKLTVTLPPPKKVVTPPGTAFANVLNILGTILAAFLGGVVLLIRRHWRRRNSPVPVYVVGGPPVAKTPTHNFEQPPVPQPSPEVPVTRRIVREETSLRVDVLGPLTIAPVNAPASDPVRAIVSYLAINADRPQTLEEIQTAIWPLTDAGTDIKKPAMRNYMVDARKTVGERHLPTASGRMGYQLRGFTTDWVEFQSLLEQATKVPKGEAAVLRRRALDLSKGPPFTAETTRYFTWTFTTSVVYKMVEAVTTLAHELGNQFVLAGDLTSAEGVLRQGLLTDPASLTLWEDLTDVLLESADQSLLELHWKCAQGVLRSEDVVALRRRANG